MNLYQISMNLEKLNYGGRTITDEATVQIMPTITCNTKYDIFEGIENAILRATNDISIQKKKVIKKQKIYCASGVIGFISCVVLLIVLSVLLL
jgi:hypothetical protein